MKHAIAILEAALSAAQNNEPIHRAAGDRKQARLDKTIAWECLDAIQVLKVTAAERKLAAKRKGGES